MLRLIWNIFFLLILSLPNLVGFIFDPTTTKLAALIIPIIFFIGLSRLISTYQFRFFLGLPLILFSFVSLNILIQFNSQITEGVIEAILNSDTLEIFEFIKGSNNSTFGILALYFLSSLFLFFQAKRLDKNKLNTSKKRFLITALLILLPIVDTIGKGASGRSYPLIIARTAYIYSIERSAMQKFLVQRESFRFNAKVTDTTKDATYIFVIGETSRRDFYSLYGYYRETTPNLDKLDDLIVFKDVISPANATVPSLKAVLHLSTADDDSKFYKTKSIVSLAKEAGFKTWWLSAQSRYGKNETSVSSSGIDSDVKHFVEEGRTLSRTYDKALLPFLTKGLDDSSARKFIVMHLYGSHSTYFRRYPKSFAIFDGKTPKGYENRPVKVQDKVNQYANSIAYTDSVLAEVIKQAKEKKQPTCMVYTADHGEYIADNLEDDFIGHGGAIPHKTEVEIPLIIWCSKQYQKNHLETWKAMKANTEQSINIEDMFYALSDLMKIDYTQWKPERSFFNQNFTPKLPRKTRASSTGEVFNYEDLK